MQIAEKLGVDEEIVQAWPKSKFEMWVSYFQIKWERENKPTTKG